MEVRTELILTRSPNRIEDTFKIVYLSDLKIIVLLLGM